MVEPPAQNYHGRRLLRTLRQLRENAGLTQDEAAQRSRIGPKKISRIETGQIMNHTELQSLLAAYDAPREKRAFCNELLGLAQERGWWLDYGPGNWCYVAAEAEAAAVVEFHLGYVPDLLQTRAYTHALGAQIHGAWLVADDRIQIVSRRQQRLWADGRPLGLHSIVHEPVLRQGVDRPQLARLIEYAQLPTVTLQILPQARGIHTGLLGSVALVRFDHNGTDEPGLAFVPTFLGDHHEMGEDMVNHVADVLKRLSRAALDPSQTLHLLKRLHDAH